MIDALEEVLRQSVCTLRIVARMTDDVSVLCAAYVAGGIIAGVLDLAELTPQKAKNTQTPSITRSMLSRLAPATRFYSSSIHTVATA